MARIETDLYAPERSAYASDMHEMSIAMSLLELAETEAAKNGCNRILKISVGYGALAGIMPEALQICFEALTREGPHMGATLELAEIPLKLRCPACNALFTCESSGIFQSCPTCGALSGLNVEEGKELLLIRLEASREDE